MKRKKFVPDPQKAKENLSDAVKTLTEEIQNLTDSESWKTYLDFQSRFHKYSFKNSLLIMAQCANATRVAGYHTWQQLGRFVKEGQHGIAIFAPLQISVQDTDDQGEEISKILTKYKVVKVFDVSQTGGKDLPEFDDFYKVLQSDSTGDLANLLCAFAESKGYHVVFEDAGEDAEGYLDPRGKKIVISQTASPDEQAKTLAHECAHMLLHTDLEVSDMKRSDKELEAESVAYIVLKACGFEFAGENSFAYIAQWQKEKDAVKTLQLLGRRIQTAAQAILDGISALEKAA